MDHSSTKAAREADGRRSPGLGSLRLRVALAILVGVGCFALLLVWRSNGELAAAYEDAGKSEVLAIARSFGADFAEADLRRPAVLQRRIEALRALNPNVEKISVYRRGGDTGVRAASTDPEELREAVKAHDLQPIETGRYEYKEEQEDGEHVAEVNFPLREQGRAPVAVLGLYLDLAPRDAALAQRQRTLTLTGLGTAVLLALLGTLLLGRAVFRPLDRLRAATQRLSDGDLRARLDGSRSDEIGVLGRAFNQMAGSLESGRAELEGQNAELAARQEALEGALAQVQRLSHQTESILNSAGEGIYGLDADGLVKFVNLAGARMTGHEPEEVIGCAHHELVQHARADGARYPLEESPVHSALREGTVQHVSDEVYWRRDGSFFPVEYTATPIREGGEIAGAVIVFKDITERRDVERMKDEFTAIVSHELRTPLTSLRGSLGLMAGGLTGALPERAQRMLNIAVTNTDRLMRLINDVLDLERIEAGQISMEKQPCRAGALLVEASEAMGAMAEQAGVALVVEPIDGELWADPDRIMQTLTNLLSNAIKFSPRGATVELAAEDQGDQLLFWVKDAGRGIPADKLKAVFERFQQVDSSDSREKGGTGLGLPICRSIVAQHGGQMWAESTLGEGSTFYFTLPIELSVEIGSEPAREGLGSAIRGG